MKDKDILRVVACVMVAEFVLYSLTGTRHTCLHSCEWRLMYVFCHAGWLHLLCNVLCIVAIVRSQFRITSAMAVVAYIIAVCAPMPGGSTTFGASGLCYALLGMMSWQSVSVSKFHATIALFVALGFVSPSVNAALHLFCYVQGVLFGRLCRD